MKLGFYGLLKKLSSSHFFFQKMHQAMKSTNFFSACRAKTLNLFQFNPLHRLNLPCDQPQQRQHQLLRLLTVLYDSEIYQARHQRITITWRLGGQKDSGKLKKLLFRFWHLRCKSNFYELFRILFSEDSFGDNKDKNRPLLGHRLFVEDSEGNTVRLSDALKDGAITKEKANQLIRDNSKWSINIFYFLKSFYLG